MEVEDKLSSKWKFELNVRVNEALNTVCILLPRPFELQLLNFSKEMLELGSSVQICEWSCQNVEHNDIPDSRNVVVEY